MPRGTQLDLLASSSGPPWPEPGLGDCMAKRPSGIRHDMLGSREMSQLSPLHLPEMATMSRHASTRAIHSAFLSGGQARPDGGIIFEVTTCPRDDSALNDSGTAVQVEYEIPLSNIFGIGVAIG